MENNGHGTTEQQIQIEKVEAEKLGAKKGGGAAKLPYEV